MKVLGVDPGVATTGFAVVSRSGGAMSASAIGALRTPADVGQGARLALLRAGLIELLESERPQQAALERVFFNSNVRTAMAVGQAAGVVLATLAEANVETFEYTPPQVKQAVVGFGSASKAQVQTMVARLLDLPGGPPQADAADACALAICHLNTAGFERAVRASAAQLAGRAS